MAKKKSIMFILWVVFGFTSMVFSVYSFQKKVLNEPVSALNTEVEKEETTSKESETNYEDWTEETHSKKADQNYETVFPQEEVNRLDIVISEEDWQIMLEDMETLYGKTGEKSTEQRGGGQMAPPRQDEENGEMAPPSQGGGGGEKEETSDENPIFVESQIFFNDTQWYNAGIRFKGNSSLKSAWQSGTLKLPFKIDFDEFEDDYPDLKNQRFYGFKELSLSSNYDDASLLREKIATEAFDSAGVTAPQTAFYQLYIDYGEGSQYFGLYTAVEVMDDTVIENNFEEDDGNLYKAEGAATSFSATTADRLKDGFIKKTNEETDDWSDLEALSEIINSDTRETDYETWKNDLEKIFDTDVFLNWLAVNTVIQNWDTYGNMTHNYYLYNNPETETLTWLPWDNNESFSNGKKSALSLTFNEVSEEWPLIRYLMNDEAYQKIYLSYLDNFLENTFTTDEFKERISFLHELIEPYVIGENGEQDNYTLLRNDTEFVNSLSSLFDFIEERTDLGSKISLDDDWEYDETLSQQNQRGGGGGGRRGGGEEQGMRMPPNIEFPDGWDDMTEEEQRAYMEANRPEDMAIPR